MCRGEILIAGSGILAMGVPLIIEPKTPLFLSEGFITLSKSAIINAVT